jgi:hypothetical protein
MNEMEGSEGMRSMGRRKGGGRETQWWKLGWRRSGNELRCEGTPVQIREEGRENGEVQVDLIECMHEPIHHRLSPIRR